VAGHPGRREESETAWSLAGNLTIFNSVEFVRSSPMCLEELCVSVAVEEEVGTLTTKNSTKKITLLK
jgi:hypothetical protein